MKSDSLVGSQLGTYRIQAILGQGGMACVYKAVHEGLQREVAIKVILPHYADQPDFQVLFEREARLVAKLHHRNIVAVHDFGTINNLTYLAMEYVNGGTLLDQLRDGQPLEPRRAAIYALQMARALHHAHSQNIIHRDVKPANMLIPCTNTDELLLSDFGIAKLFDRDAEVIVAPSTEPISGRNTSKLAGTPSYMAPEQIENKRVDSRTDIYALGVILYEMLTGTLPFQANNNLGMYYQHVYVSPRPVREVNPTVPQALEHITMRALAKAPEERFQSADEVAQALKALLVPPLPPPIQSSSIAPPPRRQKGVLQIKTIATVLIIILIVVQILMRLGFLH